MLRRGYSNGGASLPTHGGSNSSGYSSPGYGGSMHGSISAKQSKRRQFGGGYSPLAFTAIAMGVLNMIITGLWMSSKGNYRSLLQGMNARDASGVVEKIRWTEKEMATVRREMKTKVREEERRFGDSIRKLQNDKLRYKKQCDELRDMHESPEKIEQQARFLKREPEYMQQIDRMQKAIRKESKRTIMERFGAGPYLVQMIFEYDRHDYDFTIELAPLFMAPHAIHLFLEQVEHGLWNNTYFYANTEHVLQAGPSYPNGLEDMKAGHPGNVEAFKSLRLDELAFPDYSQLYPHEQWTVGFASRPGGPDWYINKIDNIESHGPGGQVHRALEEQGDSCFGRIVKGREYIENILFPLPSLGTGDYAHFLREQILIKQAILLTKRPDPGTAINLEEIPEPEEFQFGRALKQALDPLEQSLIEHNTIEVKVLEESISKEEGANTKVGVDQEVSQSVQRGSEQQETAVEIEGTNEKGIERPPAQKESSKIDRPKPKGTKEGFVLGASAMDFGEELDED